MTREQISMAHALAGRGERIDRPSDWHRSATRWLQIALVENDPQHIDLGFWEDVIDRSGANALCISAGGYVAYYPTAIPYHHRSSFLGERDLFGELVDVARRRGMHVMARIDPHAVHADAAQAHPEWLQRSADGAAQRHPSYDQAWLTCPFSEYHSGFLTEVTEEIVREYDIDAVFANRWTGHGVSHSEAARRQFRDATGHDLPMSADDDAWPVFEGWRREYFSGLIRRWDRAVRAINPTSAFIPSLGSGYPINYFDRDVIESLYPFFVLDKQSRRIDETIWSSGLIGKRARALFRDRRVLLLSNVGPEVLPRWKDAVLPAAELTPWLVDGFAHGAVPWVSKFNGQVHDPRWVDGVVEAFGLHARVEDALDATSPMAQVAVFEPARPIRGGLGRSEPFAHESGFYQALVEAGIPFELVSDAHVDLEDLQRFDLLVIPHAPALSQNHAEEIAEFVRRGGSLLVAGETSLSTPDSAGQALGLGEALGVQAHGARGPLLNNYLSINPDHPALARFAPADRTVGGTRVVDITTSPEAEVAAWFIPDYPDVPMEEVYPRDSPTRPAIVTTDRPDSGRTAYVAFDLGEVAWKYLLPDHSEVISSLVSWLIEEPVVQVDTPALLDVAVRRAPGRLVAILVNLTNPYAMRGFQRQRYPTGPVTVRLRLPEAVSDLAVKLRATDATDIDVEIDGAEIVVTVPSFDLLEVVDVTWTANTES